MSRTAPIAQSDSSKYPASIQRLFAPRPPLPYRAPADTAPEQRRTHHITPIARALAALKLYQAPQASQAPTHQPAAAKTALVARAAARAAAFERQLAAWNDPESLVRSERQHSMKDPYRTVFVARLPYVLTELELSTSLAKFGAIESVRIIRDGNKSRGYGFVVFERDADARACVRELAPVGLRLGARVALVDIERGRIVRHWKPRRLGGGLGGRHYTKPSATHNPNALAAASGRRLHLPANPHARPQGPRPLARPPPGAAPGAGPAHAPLPPPPAYAYTARSQARTDSVRDRRDRSIRNIRNY